MKDFFTFCTMQNDSAVCVFDACECVCCVELVEPFTFDRRYLIRH